MPTQACYCVLRQKLEKEFFKQLRLSEKKEILASLCLILFLFNLAEKQTLF